ncbi:MAG: hypothetical protein IJ246_03610 [Clostridia bacterium]|nr:hypothetical protein [Clostridia bacterium]
MLSSGKVTSRMENGSLLFTRQICSLSATVFSVEETVEKFARVCAPEGRSAVITRTYSPVCAIGMNFRNPIPNVRT